MQRNRPIVESDITVGENVPPEAAQRLLEMLNKYRDCIALTIDEIGCTDIMKMNIELKSQEVVRCSPYRIPEPMQDEVESLIENLEKTGIIEKSTSEYCSPMIVKRKKTGELRLCVDYRQLNSITKKMIYPVPNIEETLNTVANARVYTSLDMMSGFYQCEIDENSRKFTAFITPTELYQFKRMPFGLCNAPCVFMMIMAQVLRGINKKRISAYMDDILITSDNINEGFTTLEELLIRLREAKMTLNLEKCEFFKTELNYLGHKIGHGTTRPGDLKSAAIEAFHTPKDKEEVRRFLGLTGFFRRYVKDYGIIASPLTQLLKKEVDEKNWPWTEVEQAAFEKLKLQLRNQPVLTAYDREATHEIHCDACSKGIAGILIQRKGEDQQAVAYYSRATTDAESRYHSYELETIAVMESLIRFKFYVMGKKITIVTDCKSLVETYKKKDIDPKVSRHWLKMLDYEFDMKYRKKEMMAHADALSRCPVGAKEKLNSQEGNVMAIRKADGSDWIRSLQMQDDDIKHIVSIMRGEIKDKEKKRTYNHDYVIKEEKLYRRVNGKEKFVVPRQLKIHVAKTAHDDIGHPGTEKTFEALGKMYWFPRMRQFVKKYVDRCVKCLHHKTSKDENRYTLHVPEKPKTPFSVVHADLLGPFIKSKKRKQYIFGIVDAATRFCILKAVPDATTKHAIQTIDDGAQFFGLPGTIVTDRGTTFSSKQFQAYCRDNDIKHSMIAARTPRGNGQVERIFRVVGKAVPTMCSSDGKDWDEHVKAIQWGINSLTNKSTGMSPSSLLLAYNPKSILGDNLLNALSKAEHSGEEDIPLSELRELAHARSTERRTLHAAKFNKTHKPPSTYEEGDLVLLKMEPQSTGESRKLHPRYKGPYRVNKVLSADRYETFNKKCSSDHLDFCLYTSRYEVVDNEKRKGARPFTSVYSADRMKHWCQLEDFEDDNGTESEPEDDDQ